MGKVESGRRPSQTELTSSALIPALSGLFQFARVLGPDSLRVPTVDMGTAARVVAAGNKPKEVVATETGLPVSVVSSVREGVLAATQVLIANVQEPPLAKPE